jgi:hypothetical protein
MTDSNLPKTIRTPRISRRIREIVNLLLSGECTTIKAAAARVGMHQNYVSGKLKTPEIRVFIERRSRETVTAGTLRASARLLELLDADSEHVSFDASKHVLAIAGIAPAATPGIAINVDVKAGYVIDLSSDDRPMRIVAGHQSAPRVIEHEPDEGTDDEPE